MSRRGAILTLVILGGLTIVIVSINSMTMKRAEAETEAGTRCADPAVRNDRTIERCVGDMMSYYHINRQLPRFGVALEARQRSEIRTATLSWILTNNIYLFTPGDNGETGDYDQLDHTLQNIDYRYRVISVQITERKRYIAGNITSDGIAHARIFVELK
jgi:hypothetical protein